MLSRDFSPSLALGHIVSTFSFLAPHRREPVAGRGSIEKPSTLIAVTIRDGLGKGHGSLFCGFSGGGSFVNFSSDGTVIDGWVCPKDLSHSLSVKGHIEIS